MHRTLVVCALCGLSVAARAAEPGHWTGLYYGLNAGYHRTVVETDLASTPFNPANGFVAALARAAQGNFGQTQEGFIGGMQTGMSWNLGTIFIAGIEADIQGLSGDTSVVTTQRIPGGFNTTTDLTMNTEVDYLATLRGRFGVLVNPTLLIYGTGGLALGFAHSDFTIGQPSAFEEVHNNDTLVGWTAGAGVERFFQGTWSLRAEYLYYDLGDISASVTVRDGDVPVNAQPIPYMRSVTTAPLSGNIARISLNVRLD